MTKALIFKFRSEPLAGFSIEHDGQQFTISKAAPHQRLDGAPSYVLTWATACRECGAEVGFATGNGFTPARRNCDNHKWKLGAQRTGPHDTADMGGG